MRNKMPFEDITKELAKVPPENAAALSAEIRKMELHYIQVIEGLRRDYMVATGCFGFCMIITLMLIANLILGRGGGA